MLYFLPEQARGSGRVGPWARGTVLRRCCPRAQTLTPRLGLEEGHRPGLPSALTTTLRLVPPLYLRSFFYVFGMTSLWTRLICWIRKVPYRGWWVDPGLCRATSSGWTAAALASDQRFSDFKPQWPFMPCVPFPATLKDSGCAYGTIDHRTDPLPSCVKSASALD